jgi:LacI family transcriptional regulator
LTTVKDIAKMAGVTPTTVSAVLNRRYVPTRPKAVARAERIREIARREGYRPNTAARAVVRGRFNAAGLLYRDRQGFPPKMLGQGVYQALQERGMSLSLAALPNEEILAEEAGDRDTRLPHLLQELSLDGMLVYYAIDIPASTFAVVRRQGVPTIWLDMKGDSDCVYVDEVDGSRKATELLLRQGHRNIANAWFNTYKPARHHHSALGREEGYRQAMEAAGLTPRLWRAPHLQDVPHGNEADDRLALARQWLSQPDRPTAVVTYEEDVAGPLLMAAAMLGLSVPRDLSVISFHNTPIACCGIAVSTMLIPITEVGRRGVQMLGEKIDAPGKALAAATVTFDQPVGATVAPPVVP